MASLSIAADKISRYHELQEAGAVLMLLSWTVLVVLTARLFSKTRSIKSVLYQHICLLIALLPIGVRVLYGVVYTFNHSPSVNHVTSSFALLLILVFLMLLLGSLVLVAGGILSRGVVEEYKDVAIPLDVPAATGRRDSGAKKPVSQYRQMC